MRFLGSILIIFSGTMLGFYYAGLVKSRVREMGELQKYMTVLKGEIRYGRMPLPEAMDGIARRCGGIFRSFFKKTADNLYRMEGHPFYEIWELSVEEELKGTSLRKEEKEELKKLGESLGGLDAETQLATISLYLEDLAQKRSFLEAQSREKTRLYRILGLLGGIFVTILLV